MRIASPSQLTAESGERRAALVPAVVKKLAARGIEVAVEAGLGRGAHHSDEEYREAGASIVAAGASDLWSQADVVVTIHPPTEQQVDQLKQGAVLIGTLAPLKHGAVVRKLAARNVTTFSTEFIPRISRAQAMDVLSSQANIAGYRAVILAATHASKMFPMMITAAGTIAPARVFILGAGVAGLQAIATAKRLGAIVEAYDIRPEVKEQIMSLGARFADLGGPKVDGSAQGGYARELTDDEKKAQAEAMARFITNADCVITTAAVFGKAPPMLIPADVVSRMKPGSVIIDMAADVDAGRGNCEVTKPGQCYATDNGVVIDGPTDLPSQASIHASQVYAANMQSFLHEIIVDTKDDSGASTGAAVKLNLEDEIQKGAAITHDGQIVNERVKAAIGNDQ